LTIVYAFVILLYGEKYPVKSVIGKFIAVVPPELQEQFDDIQLKNSIRRIRFLTIIALTAKIINVVFKYISNEHLQDGGLFSLFDYSELAVIALFNVSIFFFKKRKSKRLLWILCYLLIASFFILYEFTINSAGTIEQIPFIFFVTIFLFSLLPDFKPQIFIPYAILYFIATTYILMSKNQNINEYFGVQSHILNILIIILVTKILLYNSKVKTFVNTYEINKLNANLTSAKQELQIYNDNLEAMVAKKAQRIAELQNTVLETVAELVESRDDATGCHVTRTSGYLKT